MDPQLREGLHGGQDGDGEQLALDVGEDARGEGLVEDPVLEDVEQFGIRGVRLRLHAKEPGEGLTSLWCQCHGGLLTIRDSSTRACHVGRLNGRFSHIPPAAFRAK